MSNLAGHRAADPIPVTLADGRTLVAGEDADIDPTLPRHRRLIARGSLIATAPDTGRLSDGELIEFLEESTVAAVLAAADDTDDAGRLLAAEKSRPEPRKGVLDGLNRRLSA
jgi:hypothetical protein